MIKLNINYIYIGSSLSSKYRLSYTRCVVDNGLEKLHTYEIRKLCGDFRYQYQTKP